MSLRDIESAIEKLSPGEYEQLLAWIGQREAERKLQWLRSAVAVAMEQSARGEHFDGRSATAEIIARLDRRISTGSLSAKD